MKKSIVFFFVAALFVVAFAEDDADDDNDPIMNWASGHDYMVHYCKLLRGKGLTKAISDKDLEKKSTVELIEFAIKGVEKAMEQRPFGAKQASLVFLRELKEKAASNEPPKNVFQKLNQWFKDIF